MDQERSGYAPLKVLLCPRCGLGQLSVVVDPQILYSNYSYVTSPSEMMRRHFESFLGDLLHPSIGSVLEIGSNDGALLEYIAKEYHLRVEGVDPAQNLCDLAAGKGIMSTCALFNTETATSMGKFDLIIARHVFCHVDDWQDFIRALEFVSLPNTLIAIETPYVQDLLDGGEFDTIYHEHLSYYNFRAMQALCQDTCFQIDRIFRYPIHGGAVLTVLSHKDSGRTPHMSVEPALVFEATRNYQSDWEMFASRTRDQISSLKMLIESKIEDGCSVVGLGASAKSTVWVNACGLTRRHLNFIADYTPQKQLTFSPGTEIPIVDEGAILRELPDFVVMFCWNYQAEVLEKFKYARGKGVKFIVPVPEIKIV